MGKVYDGIDARLSDWIAAQPLFFVASAPLASEGHVNVSPKGPIGTLRVLDERTVAYLDLVGSGAETIAHRSGVPLMRFEQERPHADAWAQKKLRVGGAEALLDYQREHNDTSIDGLPAVELPSQ